MTISDLICQLSAIQKQHNNPTIEVRLGREYNNAEPFYDSFYIKYDNKTLTLVPSDRWIKHENMGK